MGLKPKKYTYLVNDDNIGTETFRKTNYIIKTCCERSPNLWKELMFWRMVKQHSMISIQLWAKSIALQIVPEILCDLLVIKDLYVYGMIDMYTYAYAYLIYTYVTCYLQFFHGVIH